MGKNAVAAKGRRGPKPKYTLAQLQKLGLGKKPDTAVAKAAGLTRARVGQIRSAAGIAPINPRKPAAKKPAKKLAKKSKK